MQRNCFKCEKPLTGITEYDSIENSVHHATCWTTMGNYGSTVFDGGEFTDLRLEMFICDDCLKACGHLVYQYRVITQRPLIEDVKIFNEAN